MSDHLRSPDQLGDIVAKALLPKTHVESWELRDEHHALTELVRRLKAAEDALEAQR